MLALLLAWHQRGKEGRTDSSLGLGEGELVGCCRNNPQLAKGLLHLQLIPSLQLTLGLGLSCSSLFALNRSELKCICNKTVSKLLQVPVWIGMDLATCMAMDWLFLYKNKRTACSYPSAYMCLAICIPTKAMLDYEYSWPSHFFMFTQRWGFPVSYKIGSFLGGRHDFLLLCLNDRKYNGMTVCMRMNNGMCQVLIPGEVWMQDIE